MVARAERLRDAVAAHPRLTALLLVAWSAIVLLARLGSPDRIVFDETYYVEDALGYLETGVEPSFAVHPTVGKWLIAAGIQLVGDRALGWRIAGALAGVLTVLVTHLLARRLLSRRRWGPLLSVAAPLLLLSDGLFLAQSRIAMLDAFLVLFVAAGVLALVVDRDGRHGHGVRAWRPSTRWVAGLAFGLAIATKWSGLLALGAAGLLTVTWEVAAARRAVAGDGPTLLRGLVRRGAAVLGSLVLLPAVVYALTWLPWLASYEHTWAADCDDVEPISACADALAPAAERLDGLRRYHVAMLDFHLGLESEHSYRADPLGWVVLERPVVNYCETCSQERADGVPTEDEDGELVAPEPCEVPVDTAGEILAVGNPLVWWAFLLGLPLLVAGAVRRDGRSAVALVPWLALWVPWLFISRTAFLFYLAPAVPFLALGVVLAIDRLDHREHRAATWVGVAAGAGLGLLAGLGTQQLADLADGWRPRLVGLAIGVGVGALVGALVDDHRDRRLAAPVSPDGRAGDGGSAPDSPHDAPGPHAAPSTPVPVSMAPGGSTVTLLARPPAAAPTDDEPADEPVTNRGNASASATHEPTPATAPVGLGAAPAARVPVLLLLAVVVAWGLWSFFGPVWYGVPLDRDVLEWRWWFRTWI